MGRRQLVPPGTVADIPQCLPCTWRLFLTYVRSKSQVPPDALANYEWRSRYRVLAEATMAAESALMTNMFGWLARYGLSGEYESHALDAQRRILVAVDWSSVSDRASALQAMAAIAQAARS